MTLEELNKEREGLIALHNEVSAGIGKARENIYGLLARRDMIAGGIEIVDKLIAQEKADKEPMAAPPELADRAGA